MAVILGGREVTVGLAESNGSLLPGYGFGHLWADCRGPGSALVPYARFEYGTTFTPLSLSQYHDHAMR